MTVPRSRATVRNGRLKTLGAEKITRGGALPPAFFRDTWPIDPVTLWENRGKVVRERPDPGSLGSRVRRVRAPHARAVITRGSATGSRPASWACRSRRLDPTKPAHMPWAPRSAQSTSVLVTRFEDMRDLPEIVRNVVPEFAPDFQRVSVPRGHDPAAVQARAFRARAARLVAANYTHRFAACDTSRFYPNATRNEVSTKRRRA